MVTCLESVLAKLLTDLCPSRDSCFSSFCLPLLPLCVCVRAHADARICVRVRARECAGRHTDGQTPCRPSILLLFAALMALEISEIPPPAGV